MAKIQGPAIFLAQFMRDVEPYNSITNIGKWVASLGYKGVQIPAWDARAIDLTKAAESKTYCDDYRGLLRDMGLAPTEVACYLQGQVLAIHPAYEAGFEGFHPKSLKGEARTQWAADEIAKCIRASANFGLRNIPTPSGGFAWHMAYPWPQRPPGLIDEAFKELGRIEVRSLDRIGLDESYRSQEGKPWIRGSVNCEWEWWAGARARLSAACIAWPRRSIGKSSLWRGAFPAIRKTPN